ncbi:MAG: hypothetical protein H6811_03140 [Phycisphaeraceae bacterium]|nr:hypothetical protein [Phycisphaeraceae bacterium]
MRKPVPTVLGLAGIAGVSALLWTLLFSERSKARDEFENEAGERLAAEAGWYLDARPRDPGALMAWLDDHPEDIEGWLRQARALEQRGEPAEAVRHAYRQAAWVAKNRIERGNAESNNPDLWYRLGLARQGLDEAEDASQAFQIAADLQRELCARAPEARNMYNLACYSALAGRTDDAVYALNRAIDLGWSNANHAHRDSDLDSIRNLPDFIRAMRRLDELGASPVGSGRAGSGHRFEQGG